MITRTAHATLCANDVFVSRRGRGLSFSSFLSRYFCRFGGFFSPVRRLLGETERLQFRHVFTNFPATGLIFEHGLRAFLGALFFLEICLGPSPHSIRLGIIGSRWQKLPPSLQ